MLNNLSYKPKFNSNDLRLIEKYKWRNTNYQEHLSYIYWNAGGKAFHRVIEISTYKGSSYRDSTVLISKLKVKILNICNNNILY